MSSKRRLDKFKFFSFHDPARVTDGPFEIEHTYLFFEVQVKFQFEAII